MSNNSHCCVVDAKGNYVEYVTMLHPPDGTRKDIPYNYTLRPGDILIETSPPPNMIKPRWNGSGWEETASLEEIAAAEAAKSQEMEQNGGLSSFPSINERVTAMEDALLAFMLGGGIVV